MPVYTIVSWGQPFAFVAEDREQLRSRLYRRTSWTWDACSRVAEQLLRGVVCTMPDYETLVLPGRWDHLASRPKERPEHEWFDDDDAAEPQSGGAAAAASGHGDSDTPLLTGGVK